MKKILLFITLISIAITQAQIVNIPDVNFKQALLSANSNNEIAKDLNGDYTNIDTNNDGEIQVSEAQNISALDISNKDISDSTGLEEFTNITYLNYARNRLIDILDLSNNINLTYLNCSNPTSESTNTSINISNNINLVELDCEFVTELTSLDLSNNPNLTKLNCYGLPSITSIDVSNNPNLSIFHCQASILTSLDVSNNPNLTELNCRSNQLTSLDLSNNPNLTKLICFNNQLTSLDVSNSLNLVELECGTNQLTTLNVSNNMNLTSLYCDENQLTSLNISNNPNLIGFDCYNNQLTTLDVNNNTNLIYLGCSDNQLTALDLNNNTNLQYLECGGNNNLEYINLKNGNNINLDISDDEPSYSFGNLPNLQTVCVDELNTDLTAYISTGVGHAVTFTKYCSFEPTQSNIINGMVRIDLDNNGCDTNDISLQNVLITANNGTESFGTFILEDASYNMFTNEGDFTTTVPNLPSYLTVTPNEQTNSFLGFGNTFTADFCIQPNQTINDVNISLIPTTQARPGFDTTYKIVYKNIGTTQLSGNITLEFDEAKLSFSSASETINSQTSNSLTFDYSNFNPFETRTIDLEFNVSAPPTTEIDDILNFTTTINPIASDYTTDDNIFVLNQTVVGSYDPNDITCLEGNQVLFADKDKYLHYIICFQNTGTASAINVVVKNILDNHLDWSTLQLESLSHNNRVAIKNGNEIEFIFENIDLPDSTTDEPNSHGFIAYKIKPKTDIALDDVILSKADIFFDYNSPIETNTTSTRIVNVLAINENTLLDFSVYPTPTENILNIKSKTEISKIEIYNKLGQLILKNETENNIDISNLTNGLYFVKVEDINGNFGVKKIMKK